MLIYRHPQIAVDLNRVSEPSDIFYGKFGAFCWARCEGKGDFRCSSTLKECAEEFLKAGCHCIVVDLEACTGMDSTFMGVLAGLAMRIKNCQGGGRLEVAGANEKNRASLEDLGLDALMEIDPTAAVWQENKDAWRANLCRWVKGKPLSQQDRCREVLEAHQTLCAANPANVVKFDEVVKMLQQELQPESGIKQKPMP